jgi:hypothetical protein
MQKQYPVPNTEYSVWEAPDAENSFDGRDFIGLHGMQFRFGAEFDGKDRGAAMRKILFDGRGDNSAGNVVAVH